MLATAPDLMRKRLALFLTVLMSMTFLTTVMSPNAVAQTSAPGETVTFTDAAGNIFKYSIVKDFDGTGHGTASQCFIQEQNGYSPGDENADDGYVCKADTVSYRIEWNAEIVDPASAKINFRFSNFATEDPFNLMLTGEGVHMGMWKYQGVTGGADLGFTGTGLGHNASMQFTNKGPFTGVWSVAYTNTEGWPSRSLGSNFLLGSRTTMGAQTSDVLADENVVVLSDTRMDVQHQDPRIDTTATTIDGKVYRGLDIFSMLAAGLASNNGVSKTQTIWPGWSALKGYFPASVDEATRPDQRFTMLNAPEGILVAVNGGTPVVPLWDGADAYIDASSADYVKFYVPWGDLPVGDYNFITRVDLLGQLNSYAKKPTFNGKPDPGIGLSCDTTTFNVLPGTLAGKTQPNNNCFSTTMDKRLPAGVFDKTDHTPANPIRLADGTSDDRIVVANRGENVNSTTFKVQHFDARHTIAPVAGSQDLAFCSVWNGDEMRLREAAPYLADGRKLTTVIPTAQVYYTTQDLRPEGAPTNLAAPNCGSPSNTSLWSQEIPTDLSAPTGVMVVIPGSESLLSQTRVDIRMTAEHYSLYENLLTDNVRNYMGVSFDSTVAKPAWDDFVDSDFVKVVKTWWETRTAYEANNSIGIGAIDYTTSVRPEVYLFGEIPEGLILTQRVYLDSCMLEPEISNFVGKAPVEDWRIVGSADPSAGCGVSDDYYIEVDWNYGSDAGWGGESFNVTWTAPAWSSPGDQYSIRSVFLPKDGTEGLYTASASGKTYTVMPSAVISSAKSTLDPVEEVNEPFTHTVGWFNYSEATVGRASFIDVLPWNGDGRGTSFQGDFWLTSVTLASAVGGSTTLIEYTSADPRTIVNDPADASNQAGGSTTWCSEADFGSAGCPADITKTTAVRFTTSDLGIQHRYFFDLNFDASGNAEGDVYANRLSMGRASGLEQPLPEPAPVQTVVFAGSIAGNVFEDGNLSTELDEPEPLLGGYTVQLLDADGDVVAETVSAEDGSYLFPDLKSGDYQVRITTKDPYELITVAGGDVRQDAVDLTTEVITLAPDEDRTDVDFGLANWPDPELVVDKSSVISSDTDEDGFGDPGDRITWTFSFSNIGVTPIIDLVITDALEGAPVDFSDPELGMTCDMGTLTGSTWTVDLLSQGETVTCSYKTTVTVAQAMSGSVTNYVSGTGEAPDGEPVTGSDTSTEPTDIDPMVLHKTVDKATAAPGETLVYTLTVDNENAYAMPLDLLVDTLPYGVTYVSSEWESTGTTFAPGTDTGLQDPVVGSNVVNRLFDPVVMVPANTTGHLLGTITVTVDADRLAGSSLVNGALAYYDHDGPMGQLDPDNTCETDYAAPVYQDGETEGEASGSLVPTTCAVTTVPGVNLSGTVYTDANANGDQDGGETGIEGWEVTLTHPDGSTSTTTTDENGFYEFTDLVAGDYTVTITDPDSGQVLTQSYRVSDPSGGTTDPAQPATVVNVDVTEVDYGLYQPLMITVQKFGQVDGNVQLIPGAEFMIRSDEGPFPGTNDTEVQMTADEAGSSFTSPGLLLAPAATYTVIEMKAPGEHSLLAEPIVFELTPEGIEILSGGSNVSVAVSADNAFVLQVTDSPAVRLPNTGGLGSAQIGSLALLLLLAAGGYGLHRRRESAPALARSGD